MNTSRIVYVDSIVALGEAIGKQLWSGSGLISSGLVANEVGVLTELHAEFSGECTCRFLVDEGILYLM